MLLRYLKTAALIGCTALFATSAMAEDPYTKPDDAWISISGTVDSTEKDAFTLDYGDGLVTVEMDDGDRDADGYKLVEGDKVTVNGRVDDDLFELTKIEASSVYVENIGTYFFASANDEEDAVVPITSPVVVSTTVLRGTVSDVDENSFQINNGSRQIKVDIDEMAYDPLDDEGYQQISEGDVVRVTGYMDHELIDGQVFDAQYVTTLVDNS